MTIRSAMFYHIGQKLLVFPLAYFSHILAFILYIYWTVVGPLPSKCLLLVSIACHPPAWTLYNSCIFSALSASNRSELSFANKPPTFIKPFTIPLCFGSDKDVCVRGLAERGGRVRDRKRERHGERDKINSVCECVCISVVFFNPTLCHTHNPAII